MSYERELEAARKAALEAGAAALRWWREGFETETKDDDSPVTPADREGERLIAAALEEAFPEDGLVGEEGVSKPGASGRRWLIDPIDGTRDFVRRNRFWCVQLALEAGRDEIVAGVVYFPALDEIYYAARGLGARRNGRPIRVSGVGEPSRAVLCLNDLGRIHREAFGPRFLEWAARFWAVRNPGGAPGAMMVASGKAEVWFEPCGAAWDLAPVKIITEEAGGVFRNFDGGSSVYAGNCFACTPEFEAELRRFLG